MNLHCFCDSEFLRQWLSVWAAHKNLLGTFLMVQWLRLCPSNAGGPGSIPSQGTRSHMSQLRVHVMQLRPSAAK